MMDAFHTMPTIAKVSFHGVSGLMVAIEFHGLTEAAICKWLTRILEANCDFRQHMIPTAQPIDYVEVVGFREDELGQWPIHWRMSTAKPGVLSFPPWDEQGREVV